MIRLVLIGVWACGVALGAQWGASVWLARQGPSVAAAAEKKPTADFKKAKPLSVPIVADGAVQGYVVAQLGYVLDPKAMKEGDVNPEVFLLDEAFRAIYSSDKVDFRKLERYDLDRLTRDLLARVRARLKSDVVKDVVVQEFNFVPKGDLRH